MVGGCVADIKVLSQSRKAFQRGYTEKSRGCNTGTASSGLRRGSVHSVAITLKLITTCGCRQPLLPFALFFWLARFSPVRVEDPTTAGPLTHREGAPKGYY